MGTAITIITLAITMVTITIIMPPTMAMPTAMFMFAMVVQPSQSLKLWPRLNLDMVTAMATVTATVTAMDMAMVTDMSTIMVMGTPMDITGITMATMDKHVAVPRLLY